MRFTTPLIAATAGLLIFGCGTASDSNDTGTDQIDASFLEAFPSGSDLALTTDSSNSDDEAAATGDDLQNGAGYNDGVIDDVSASEPEILTIGNLTCGRFTGTRDDVELQLTACKLDRFVDRWAYRLEGRPVGGDIGTLGDEDPAATLDGDTNPVPPSYDWATLSAGKGRKIEGLVRRAVAGVVVYNFDATSFLFNEGPTGKVAIGYRLVPSLRRIRVVQLNHSHDGVAPAVTARTGYIRVPGVGGLWAKTGWRDSFAVSAAGTIEVGQDGIAELGHLRFGWNSAGDGRSVAWVCGGSLGDNCYRDAACYDASGTITYDISSQTLTSDITWDEVACSAPSVDLNAEEDFVNADSESLDVDEPAEI